MEEDKRWLILIIEVPHVSACQMHIGLAENIEQYLF
jgi:hypothetical protein